MAVSRGVTHLPEAKIQGFSLLMPRLASGLLKLVILIEVVLCFGSLWGKQHCQIKPAIRCHKPAVCEDPGCGSLLRGGVGVLLSTRELVLGTEISPVASVLSPVSPRQPGLALAVRPPFSPGGRGPASSSLRLQVFGKNTWRPQPRAAPCVPEFIEEAALPDSWAPQRPEWQGSHWGFPGSRESWEGHDWCLAGMGPTPPRPWAHGPRNGLSVPWGPGPPGWFPLASTRGPAPSGPPGAQLDCRARNWPSPPGASITSQTQGAPVSPPQLPSHPAEMRGAGEQLRCLELQGELRRELLQELAEFMRRCAEVLSLSTPEALISQELLRPRRPPRGSSREHQSPVGPGAWQLGMAKVGEGG